MEVISKVPVTLDERLEYGEEMRIPATWEEFLDLLEECEYRIEYDEGAIISFMGYGIDIHEVLVVELAYLLRSILKAESHRLHGSNLALYIPGFLHRHYNADCALVIGEPEKVVLRGDMMAIANPVLLVEILSPTTRNFDLNRKFENYKTIPSLKQVLFIESEEKKVFSYRRQNDWKREVFSQSGNQIPILGEGSISLDELYWKINFDKQH